MKLTDLLEKQFNLPSIPKVVALLLLELDKPEIDLLKVTQLISTDPALTTRLLQMGNSSFFKMQGKISSVSEALALLDLNHLRKMAQAAADVATPKAVPGINLNQFWEYSLNVARVSRSLAGLVKINQQEAFTCAMIHAIGELAMHLGMPDEVSLLNQKIAPLDLRRAKAERKEFGYCYATVGAGYARLWQFPQAMVDALEYQYEPFENNVYEPLAGIINLSAWRARCKEASMDERRMAVTFPDEVAVPLGLNMDTVLQQDPFDWAAYT